MAPWLSLVGGWVCLTGSAGTVPDASWRSTLFPEGWTPRASRFSEGPFIQDFSDAGAFQGRRPLPSSVLPVNRVMNADPTGVRDATAVIQATLDRVGRGGGGTVLLPPGTFRVHVPEGALAALTLRYPRVVLKGASSRTTRLLNATTDLRNRAILAVEGPEEARWRRDGRPGSRIRTDLLGPATEIPVESTTPFRVGQPVVVRMTVTPEWVKEHREPGWLGYEARLGGLIYHRRVVGVDATQRTLTLDVPTRYELRVRDEARVEVVPELLDQVGLEDFSIGNQERPGLEGWGEEDLSDPSKNAYFAHGSSGISVVRAQNSWVRRVASFAPEGNRAGAHLLSNGLVASEYRALTLEHVHLQRPQYGGAGGNGYMVRLSNCNDVLVSHTTTSFSRHGLVLSGMGSSGNVFWRCTDEDTGWSTGGTGQLRTAGTSSDHHMHFSHSNLFDQCVARSSWFSAAYRPYGSDPKHRQTSAFSVYWNTRGEGTGGPVVVSAQARWGMVIGTSGSRSQVSLESLNPTATDPVDWVEGVGRGSTLAPASLYDDQVRRRNGRAPFVSPTSPSVTP